MVVREQITLITKVIRNGEVEGNEDGATEEEAQEVCGWRHVAKHALAIVPQPSAAYASLAAAMQFLGLHADVPMPTARSIQDEDDDLVCGFGLGDRKGLPFVHAASALRLVYSSRKTRVACHVDNRKKQYKRARMLVTHNGIAHFLAAGRALISKSLVMGVCRKLDGHK